MFCFFFSIDLHHIKLAYILKREFIPLSSSNRVEMDDLLNFTFVQEKHFVNSKEASYNQPANGMRRILHARLSSARLAG